MPDTSHKKSQSYLKQDFSLQEHFHQIEKAYTELKLIPIRLVTIEKVQKLLDDLNTFIQLLQALQHRHLELTTEGEHTSEDEVEANAIKERELETLLEEIVDKLMLARAAKHCKSLEGLLDTYEESNNLSGVTEELKKTQTEIIELLDGV